MTRTVYINGKFTAQRGTGVQRVARQLVLALDALGLAGRWVLLLPHGGTALQLRCIEQRLVGAQGLPLHLWEQVALPWAARDGLLVSLAGSAPFLASSQAALMHDAAVFDHPEAYTRSFRVWYRALFRSHVRRAVRLLTVSAFSRDRLALHLRVPPDRLTVVPNGGNHLEALQPDERALDSLRLRGKRYLLAVATANPTKNLERLRLAFARIDELLDLYLVIVGGRNTDVFVAKVDATAVADRVVEAGPMTDACLKALYGSARALVFPSVYEGFGLPPLEAMSCGCPVIAARAASLPEVCGDAALYIDPMSVESLASAMSLLVNNEALRADLVAAGLAHVSHWRWSASAIVLRRVIDEVLGGDRSPTGCAKAGGSA